MMSKSSVVLATVIFAGGWGRMAMALEEPEFEVVEAKRDFEIRRDADTVVVCRYRAWPES